MQNMTHLKKLFTNQCLVITKRDMRIIFSFTYDSTSSLNTDKNQAFGIQFADNKFRNNNMIVLSFRKLASHKSDKIAELVEIVCHE